jgi:hypothetical protein
MIILSYRAVHCTALLFILSYLILPYLYVPCTAQHCTALLFILSYLILSYLALHSTALHCTAVYLILSCLIISCTALHCTADYLILSCLIISCTALHCTASHCTAVYLITSYSVRCTSLTLPLCLSMSLSTSPSRPGMHFWFNVKKTKHSWLVDFCLFRGSIFPESFFDSNSMDVDRHIRRIVPVPAAPSAVPVSKMEKEREKEEKNRERDGSNNRSPGNSLKVEDDGKLCLSLYSNSFHHSFIPSFPLHPFVHFSFLFFLHLSFPFYFVFVFCEPWYHLLNFIPYCLPILFLFLSCKFSCCEFEGLEITR